MTREPLTGAADLAAKFLALTCLRDGGTIFEPDLLAECEARAAESIASCQCSPPLAAPC
jgi:hypothetical protein